MRITLPRLARPQSHRFEQSFPLAHDEFREIQCDRQRQQPRPKVHRGPYAAPARIEHLLRRRIETAAGGSGDLSQQRFIVAVLLHFVFLAIEADFGERARIGHWTHAEQPLRLADSELAAIMPSRYLGDFERRLESVRAHHEDIGDRRRVVHVAR